MFTTLVMWSLMFSLGFLCGCLWAARGDADVIDRFVGRDQSHYERWQAYRDLEGEPPAGRDVPFAGLRTDPGVTIVGMHPAREPAQRRGLPNREEHAE
jgi:hypothetical protein